jgi:hypothetical protein
MLDARIFSGDGHQTRWALAKRAAHPAARPVWKSLRRVSIGNSPCLLNTIGLTGHAYDPDHIRTRNVPACSSNLFRSGPAMNGARNGGTH